MPHIDVTPRAVLQNSINIKCVSLMRFLENGSFHNIEEWMRVAKKVGDIEKYTTTRIEITPEMAAEKQKEIKQQWNEMKQINSKAFFLSQQQYDPDDPAKGCIIPIISNVKQGNVVAAYAISALITLSTKRAGSPWHIHDLSNLILTKGSTVSIVSIANSDDPAKAIGNMFHDNNNENRKNTQQHVDNFHYEAMQLILQRAKDRNVSAEQFSTWSLVFMFDKNDSPADDTDKLWQGDLWRPYQKIQQMITEWKSDMHYSIEYQDPTLIFYCLDGQIEEKHCHGIPIERDEHPGIILLSGNGVTSVQEIIEICCTHRQLKTSLNTGKQINHNSHTDNGHKDRVYSYSRLHKDDNSFEELDARMFSHSKNIHDKQWL
jgi:hypothetical protein